MPCRVAVAYDWSGTGRFLLVERPRSELKDTERHNSHITRCHSFVLLPSQNAEGELKNSVRAGVKMRTVPSMDTVRKAQRKIRSNT
ncbi:hypothetical protein EYF80_050491 [Liparis tanakae]|uniref:Uncharacterized protein n=1 Tax=Liparis tanakae TaxID=230148 RepID=A0A4Z2FEZ9_9TELE|nr:hypothetical protein EYF80_050491 [Liparis tanakae]